VRAASRSLAAAALAAACLAGAPARAAIIVDSGDPRCVSLPGSFPPGLDWLDGGAGIALVASFSPAVAVPVDMGSLPPAPTLPGPFADLRSAIADDACGGARDPQLDGIVAPGPELAFATASSCESVAFLDPASAGLADLSVAVPAGLPISFPFNPAPGTSELRAAISTRACLEAPAPGLDSRGDPIAPGCQPGVPSYYTSFTSGAARVGDRLFVSTSNLGAGAGTLDPQFLPGSVLVFDLDEDPPGIAPNPETPVVFTSGFNPTHVTAYTTPGGRELVLVGVSGATGLVTDDPTTPEREAGGVALGPAAIDVIDAQQIRRIATIPLGLAALSFERLGIDPTGRVAMVGSAVAREVLAVDLAPLDALDPDAPPVLLADAAIFDADHPLELPGIAAGAPPETCPGYVVGVEFSSDGERAYAADFCDGTLSVVATDLDGDPPVPVPAARFEVSGVVELVASVGPDSLGFPRAPGALRVRPGRPGIDFEGPELAFLVGLPEGLLCGVTVPAPEPSADVLRLVCGGALAILAVRCGRREMSTIRTGGAT
jgi:hypothetical protein